MPLTIGRGPSFSSSYIPAICISKIILVLHPFFSALGKEKAGVEGEVAEIEKLMEK